MERDYVGRMTRYSRLRDAVLNLAAGPDVQVAYLDKSFTPITGGRSAAGYGNNELALEFDDIFPASEHMLACGEITEDEVASIRPLDQMLKRFCKQGDKAFWEREALFADPRWEDLRRCASAIISNLPDEQRESDYARGLTSGS